MKRPTSLLFGVGISAVHLVSVLEPFQEMGLSIANLNPTSSFNDAATALGTAIGLKLGMELAEPFLIVFSIAIALEAAAYFSRMKGLALAAAIMFCACIALMPTWYGVTILPIIMAFLGFYELTRIEKLEATAAAEQQAAEQWERTHAPLDGNRMSTEDLLEQLAQRNRAAVPEQSIELAPMQKRERSENESEEDRLSRLGTQARKWHDTKNQIR